MQSTERDAAHLIEANGKPRAARAYQKAVNARGVNERNNGGVADAADAPVLQVVNRQAQQFREVEEMFRHVAHIVCHWMASDHGDTLRYPPRQPDPQYEETEQFRKTPRQHDRAERYRYHRAGSGL